MKILFSLILLLTCSVFGEAPATPKVLTPEAISSVLKESKLDASSDPISLKATEDVLTKEWKGKVVTVTLPAHPEYDAKNDGYLLVMNTPPSPGVFHAISIVSFLPETTTAAEMLKIKGQTQPDRIITVIGTVWRVTISKYGVFVFLKLSEYKVVPQ